MVFHIMKYADGYKGEERLIKIAFAAELPVFITFTYGLRSKCADMYKQQ